MNPLGFVSAVLRARRMKRRQRRVTVYRVFSATSLHTLYADQGDEVVLGRYVGRMLRAGAGTVVIETVEMTLGEAEGIPSERMIEG